MITINTSPSGSPSVHDNMWHVVSSDNSGATDFKFVFDVWINGEQKVRVKQIPESNGKGYFDAGPTVRNSMTYAWFEPLDTAYVAQPDNSGQISIKYALRVGEDVSGTLTSNLSSGEVSGYNWAPPLFKRSVIGLSDKLNKWLTNRPLTAKTKLDERLYIGFYTNASVNLKCTTYNGANEIIATASGTTTAVPFGFLQMNIGSRAIATNLGITIDDSVKYYDVQFNANEAIRVYPVCNPKYTPILIHFLNRWGVWDTHRFDLSSRLNLEVERKGYSKKDYEFNGNAVDYKSTSNRYYEGKINHANKGSWIYKLTSDALTDDEYTWLAGLMVSPQILMEVDGYFYPVTIKNSSYEYSKYENNKLRALEIDFELNQSRLTQLR